MRIPFLASAALLALPLLSALPAQAAPVASLKCRITQLYVGSHYPGESKLVNGVKVYIEGIPLVHLSVEGTDGTKYAAAMPLDGERARAAFEIALNTPKDEWVYIHYAKDVKVSRSWCRDFAPEGCIEVSPTPATASLFTAVVQSHP